jgi:hypothetical protein
MIEHPSGERLTAYADEATSGTEKEQIGSHLEHCETCRHELDQIGNLKLRLAKLPRRYAPPELLSSLHEKFTRPSIWMRFLSRLARPRVWTPLGAIALFLLLFGLWFHIQNRSVEANYIDLEPLLTAHSRYSSESSFSSPDIDRWDYSSRLASYYKDED